MLKVPALLGMSRILGKDVPGHLITRSLGRPTAVYEIAFLAKNDISKKIIPLIERMVSLAGWRLCTRLPLWSGAMGS